MGEKPEEEENKKSVNWKELIVNNLFIAIIVAGASIYMNQCSDLNVESFKSEQERKLDSINKVHEIELLKLKNHLDSSTAIKLLREELEHKRMMDSLNFINEIKQNKTKFQNEIAFAELRFRDRLAEIDRLVRADDTRNKDEKRLDFVTAQLEEFYWPILIRLEKNNAAYKLLGNRFFGSVVDSLVVLPNHLDIVNIIQSKIHLAQADSILIKELENYIGHVYSYQSLRLGNLKFNPDESGGNNFREEFYYLILDRTKHFQSLYNDLILRVHEDSLREHLPNDLSKIYKSLDLDCVKRKQEQEFVSFIDFRTKDLEIPLSYNTEFYSHKIDNQIFISFEGPKKKKSHVKLEIGPFNLNTNKFYSDSSLGAFRKDTLVEVGKQFIYKTKKRVYKIWVKDRWRSKIRDRVELSVESWNQKPKLTNTQDTISCIRYR
ncbi:hypothetical protein [Persicobacter diffluens]|uniref:Uncharacterized protein n=1 Tax=Persicobacter diffluens TaxID=981 RepID=A0AAN4W3F3_9BACT|nr:hypothetical protein PEDI_51500 [Persicobacter diffluens]